MNNLDGPPLGMFFALESHLRHAVTRVLTQPSYVLSFATCGTRKRVPDASHLYLLSLTLAGLCLFGFLSAAADLHACDLDGLGTFGIE